MNFIFQRPETDLRLVMLTFLGPKTDDVETREYKFLPT